MVATQADQPRGIACGGLLQVVAELEPLVAADQRIDQVQAQNGNLHLGVLQPRQVQALQWGLRKVECMHGSQFTGKARGSARGLPRADLRAAPPAATLG
ncbi:hypothetical protein ACIF81_10580 [Pseudomonas juntendi]|uniref:hypothetical protein n=1 Tax=Pseudomonas juntendi TaxID=2666183 RepID=UPI0037CB546C